MAYKPTGRPVGRPRTKHYRTISLKMPMDLLDRVKTYASRHRQSLSALIRDGLEWRITAGAPRWPLANGSGYARHTRLGDLVTLVHLLDAALPFDAELPTVPAAQSLSTPGVQAPAPVPLTLAETRESFWYCPPFNTALHSLQPLCKHRHEWGTTGRTLKTIKGSSCLECKVESQRRIRKAKASQKRARHLPHGPAPR
jgi:hypothetical protein